MWLIVPVVLVVVLIVMLLGSLFAGVFWLIGNAWPWLLIGLGAWLFWHNDGRHYRRRQRRAALVVRNEPQPRANGKASAVAVATAPTKPVQTPQPKKAELPIDMQVKVEQIRRKVDVLLGYADRFAPFSQDLYLVRETASEYLPRTIDTFLALPADSVDKPLDRSGKTPRQELKAQLDLLDAKLDEIALDLQRQDADRLLANRRFLESRFGSRESEVTVS